MKNPIFDKFIKAFEYFDFRLEEGKGFVDKTDLIYKLASKRGLFYLARPDHFPQTPTQVTLKSLFKDGLKYFTGCKIEKLGWEAKTYPVMHIVSFYGDSAKIDMVGFGYYDENNNFIEQNNFQDFNVKNEDFLEDLEEIIKQTNGEIVVLIDNIDHTCTSMPEYVSDNQKKKFLTKKFLLLIQKYAQKIRFCLVTGNYRNPSIGLLEGPHPFTDLTFDEDFSTLFGLTDEELDTYFAQDLENAAKVLEVTKEELREKLRSYYGNYSFDLTGKKKVYDPWDIHKFLTNPSWEFDSYWNESRPLSFMVGYALYKIYLEENPQIQSPFRDTYTFSKQEFLNFDDVLSLPIPIVFFLYGSQKSNNIYLIDF